MEDLIISACLKDRRAWEVVNGTVEDDMTPQGQALMEGISSYYAADDSADSIQMKLFAELMERDHPDQYQELLLTAGQLPDVSVANVLRAVASVKKGRVGRDLAAALVNDPESPTTESLLREFQTISSGTEIDPAAEYAEDVLVELADDSKRITIYPKAIDERLSEGARHGHHIVVMARPNIGKTAFCINLARGLLRDGWRVLYLSNEEPTKVTLKRLIGRILNKTSKELTSDIHGAIQEAEPLLKNFYIKDLSPGTFQEIRGLTKSIKPDVVILDQLRNIKSRDDNRVTALDKLAQEARALGKENDCLVVSVTQAGDSARDKLVLDDGDIDYSNTGIPASCDLIIGIGADNVYKEAGKRMITIVKNKMGDDHSSFPARFDAALSKVLA